MNIERAVNVNHCKMIADELVRIASARRYDLYRTLSEFFPKRVVAEACGVSPRTVWIATVQQYCGANLPYLTSIAKDFI